MRARRTIRRSTLVILAALAPAFIACDGATEPPNELVGTWNATSLIVDGFDVMDEGMTLRFTFSANGEYSYTVTNDLLGFCDPGPNCTDGGDFTVSGNQITFDPGEVTEETYTYSISGSTLTVSATFDGSDFTFTFTRQ